MIIIYEPSFLIGFLAGLGVCVFGTLIMAILWRGEVDG